ncbi:hypothetical protein G3480_21925 [Thiorhodococcus mannitoliphagus]|uniref:Uncharacterized protein n=1 Tax=Thiorhodococcus mannitoliphagus TaxID=329406 RepID=A0A6P1DX85_9GAMM|nr:hypothetical protein [Thiorhodococcus mannitoliphagus]NEX22927.1 hypothetical protein [Thiorhodococcus mannitoliphagus]
MSRWLWSSRHPPWCRHVDRESFAWLASAGVLEWINALSSAFFNPWFQFTVFDSDRGVGVVVNNMLSTCTASLSGAITEGRVK